ncbi:FHA domain-containing protein [Sphaerisporangium perillae]|uniref:FHA domain-containing protein n=1 Tax=Sphaerisporangium perillae TaxID=2935860 RepID=UPI00200F2211|nr:FHA domain-containing protein [Sphaerisporangium perillae]
MATCPVGHDSSDEEYCDICGALMSGTPAQGAPEAPAPAGPPSAPGASGSAAAGGEQLDACPDCGAPRSGRFCETCGYDFVLGGGSRTAQPAPAPPPPGNSSRTAPPSQSWQPAQPVRPGQSWQPSQPVQPAAPSQPWQPSRPVQPAPPSRPAQAGSSWQPAQPVPGGSPATGGAPAPAPAGGWVAVIAADRAYYDTMISQGGPDAAWVAFPPYCPERQVSLAGTEMRIGRRSQSRALAPEIDLSGPPEDPGVSHLHAVLLALPDGTWQLVDPGSANGTMVNGETVEINVPVPLADGDRVHVGAWTVITVRRA